MVESVRLAFNASSATFPSTTSPTWAELSPHWPARKTSRHLTQELYAQPRLVTLRSRGALLPPVESTVGDPSWPLAATPTDVPGTRFAAAFEALADQPGPVRAEDSDTSSSSATASDQELQEATILREVCWSCSLSRDGRLHYRPDGSTSDLACRRSLRNAEPGQGLHSALATGRAWSPTCFRRLPTAAQEWWSESFTIPA